MSHLLAFGAKVAPAFRDRVVQLCDRVSIPDPSWLMASMAFETGETFSPSIRNAAGSGAIGLIQFMPSTCAAYGVTVAHMAVLTAVEQLDYVERYFMAWNGRLKTLGDVYGAILWPGMIGKPDSLPIFHRDDPNHPKLYVQNRGLDYNSDGEITKAEIVQRIQDKLRRGMMAGYASEYGA